VKQTKESTKMKRSFKNPETRGEYEKNNKKGRHQQDIVISGQKKKGPYLQTKVQQKLNKIKMKK